MNWLRVSSTSARVALPMARVLSPAATSTENAPMMPAANTIPSRITSEEEPPLDISSPASCLKAASTANDEIIVEVTLQPRNSALLLSPAITSGTEICRYPWVSEEPSRTSSAPKATGENALAMSAKHPGAHTPRDATAMPNWGLSDWIAPEITMHVVRMIIVGIAESMATPIPCTNSVAGPVMPAADTDRVANQRWEVKKEVDSHEATAARRPMRWHANDRHPMLELPRTVG
mmetsp:Transcript_35689/g.84484  ORF Transcript_35689/g.84484 Transcript_35689/m.84484 type:complete len:233 (-) Transcript_35689:1227-1925(-)